MTKPKLRIEAKTILENLDEKTLEAFAGFSNSKYYPYIEEFARRYVETKRNQILDLSTDDERKFANGASLRKGMVAAIGDFIGIIKESSGELDRRNKRK